MSSGRRVRPQAEPGWGRYHTESSYNFELAVDEVRFINFLFSGNTCLAIASNHSDDEG